MKKFKLHSEFKPGGDQPSAIAKINQNIQDGIAHQTLLGVTGSGKTFTMANVIEQNQRPTLILAHNKTLAAQLYGEMKAFFPENAVEYFVSYYDYYQPESYVPTTDTFIEKDASINEHIEQMRLSATRSLLERRDVIIVASVSAIYGLGAPETYMAMILHLSQGTITDQRSILRRLAELQYQRNEINFTRGTFRVRGDVIDIFPADSDTFAVRVELFDNEVERLSFFDPLTGKIEQNISRITIHPKNHYVTPKAILERSMVEIKADLKERQKELLSQNKLLEEQRLTQRTNFDLEMMQELGYCSGIENYSRYLSGRKEGDTPATLFNYLPADGLLFIDESHVTIPQIGAMYKGDRSRKLNLVEYGFRLPSALDNRPLKFSEFEDVMPQTIYVSATPAKYELEKSEDEIVEQVVRPTGLLDPIIEVRPVATQVDDLLSEINKRIALNERVLVTTLTKKMAENLTDYLHEHKIKVKYLHSDIHTVERMEIIRSLRLGEVDVLIGINLLREGLDIPEVSLVAVLDADREGFLRSESALIQTVGRAARNVHGKAILYGDTITKSMQKTIDETARRRAKQEQFNQEHHIKPKTIIKQIKDVLDSGLSTKKSMNQLKAFEPGKAHYLSAKEAQIKLKELEAMMLEAAKNLEFEKATVLRDEIKQLKADFVTLS